MDVEVGSFLDQEERLVGKNLLYLSLVLMQVEVVPRYHLWLRK